MKNTLLDERTEKNWDQMFTFIPVDTPPENWEIWLIWFTNYQIINNHTKIYKIAELKFYL